MPNGAYTRKHSIQLAPSLLIESILYMNKCDFITLQSSRLEIFIHSPFTIRKTMFFGRLFRQTIISKPSSSQKNLYANQTYWAWNLGTNFGSSFRIITCTNFYFRIHRSSRSCVLRLFFFSFRRVTLHFIWCVYYISLAFSISAIQIMKMNPQIYGSRLIFEKKNIAPSRNSLCGQHRFALADINNYLIMKEEKKTSEILFVHNLH